MEARPREILIFQTEDDREPFSDWMDTLQGQSAYGAIMVRLDRVEDGNLGDTRSVGGGVSELRIDHGPGYRVYFGQHDDLVILLCGGTKKTQDADIKNAQNFWKAYKNG